MHKPILTLALIAAIGGATLALSLRVDTIAPPQTAAAVITSAPTSWMGMNQRHEEELLHPDEVFDLVPTWRSPDYSDFTHPETGLTFSYPKRFTSFYDVFPDSDLVIFQDTQLGMGIQLFTQEFDEPASAITAERIARNLPDLEITNLGIFPMGAGRIDLRFKREDPALGTVWEYSIAKDGYLSQLTVYAPASLLDSYFLGLTLHRKQVRTDL